MKIYKNGANWVIEDHLDKKLVEKINDLIDKNLNHFLKLKEGYSTKGKNSEQYWIMHNNFYFKNKNFDDIKIECKSQILNRLKKSNILDQRIREEIDLKDNSCWSVIGEENSYHTLHSHKSDFEESSGISAVIYLKVPETNVENSPENNLALLMGTSVTNHFYNKDPEIISINPVVGKILIFPVWVIHGTYPQSKGIRQTFNINYTVTHDHIKKSDIYLNYT
jgi:hypothetical protein